MGNKEIQTITIDELKSKIQKLFDGAHSMHVYLILKEGDIFSLKLADIENQKTAPELEKMFSSYLKTNIVENGEASLHELSITEERVNTIYHYDYDEYPGVLDIIRSFDITDSIKHIDKFDFQRDDLSALYGYIVYIGSMTNGIVLFKKHYPISLIKRDSFLLGMVKNSKRFEKMDGEDIIRLNGDSQIFCLDKEIYVTDINVLEKFIGFTQLIYKDANEALEAINDLNILEDIEALRDSVEDISFARKLSKVKTTSPIFKLGITKETIIDFTKNTTVLSGKFKYSEDGKSIVLDTKKSKEAFLKLMNDAFLRSELTKQYYEALSKDSMVQ